MAAKTPVHPEIKKLLFPNVPAENNRFTMVPRIILIPIPVPTPNQIHLLFSS